MNLRERVDALAARNAELTDEESKERFLELLAEGRFPEEAAKMVGRTGTWFRRRRNPSGANYDTDFHSRYEDVMAMEHPGALAGRLRTMLVEAAESGNVRATINLLMAYDPDFSFLRPQSAIGDINVEKLQVLLPQIPTEMLEQMRDTLIQAKQKELPVLDA